MINDHDQSDDRWKEKLTPEEYRVIREKGTEPAFSGELLDNKEHGMYACRACGEPLFSSDTKFDSGSGWPSFFKPVSEDAVDTESDGSFGMSRTEVVCKKCGGHLGHVFPDAPEKNKEGEDTGGQRYCINSLSLDFNEEGESESK